MHLPVSSQDSTIDFEKRRNVPVRYDRELMQTTIHAMKRVAEVKKRREHAFWKNRYSIKLSRNKVADNFQDGYKPGKTQSSSEEAIGKSNFCPLTRTTGRSIITREDQNKNPESRKAQKCSCYWRGSIYGYGDGLAIVSVGGADCQVLICLLVGNFRLETS